MHETVLNYFLVSLLNCFSVLSAIYISFLSFFFNYLFSFLAHLRFQRFSVLMMWVYYMSTPATHSYPQEIFQISSLLLACFLISLILMRTLYGSKAEIHRNIWCLWCGGGLEQCVLCKRRLAANFERWDLSIVWILDFCYCVVLKYEINDAINIVRVCIADIKGRQTLLYLCDESIGTNPWRAKIVECRVA